jgi:S-(hydroxymethyl)glutathione dehydrogenase/alcohol dehydrogenase
MNKDKIVSMSAAVLFENKKNLKIIKNIEIPELKKGQVLVEISYTSICHSQLMEIQGQRGKDKYLPHMLGHEGCGEVLKIGKGVKKVKKGDSVIIGWIKGNGLNVSGANYKKDKYQINSGPVTTFSTHSIISENRLVVMPKNLNKKYASLYGCAIPTGIGMILNQTSKRKNKNICCRISR